MEDKVRIFFLGGLDEEGRILVVCEINQDIFLIDYGIKFLAKNYPGIDFVLPNPSYLIENKDRIKALFLSHSHHENAAGIQYMNKFLNIPIYCSLTTATILNSRAEAKRIKPEFDFHIVESSSTFEVAGRRIDFFQVCHNMAYTSGISIHTSLGNIIYSSDFIFEDNSILESFRSDLKKMCSIAEEPTLVLLCESANATKEGFVAPFHRYTPHFENIFSNAEGRIMMCSFSASSYAIREIVEMANKYRRKICLVGDVTEEIFRDYLKLGIIRFNTNNFIKVNDLVSIKDNEVLCLYLQNGEELYKYSIQYAKGIVPDSRFLIKPSDTLVLAAPPSLSLEQEFTKAVDALYSSGAHVYYFSRKEIESMHAKADDIRILLNIFKPKYYIPYKGMFSNLVANARIALNMNIGLNQNNIFVLDNGMPVVFDEKGARIIEDKDINYEPSIVDKDTFSTLNYSSLNERSQMATDGFVLVAGSISLSKQEFTTKPDVQMKGFVFTKESEPLVKFVSGIFIEEIIQAFRDNRYKKLDIEAKIKDRISSTLKRKTRRNPFVIVNIIEQE